MCDVCWQPIKCFVDVGSNNLTLQPTLKTKLGYFGELFPVTGDLTLQNYL